MSKLWPPDFLNAQNRFCKYYQCVLKGAVVAFNRRDFLKISAAGTAVAAVPDVLNAMTADSPAGEISVWTTSGTRRHAKQAPLQWGKSPGTDANTISIDPSREYQSVL